MNSKQFLTGAALCASLVLAACGGESDESALDDDQGFVTADESVGGTELPADLPQELIPPQYEGSDYIDLRAMGGMESVTFQSTAPARESIEYYSGLIGEPTLATDSAEGESLAQWNTTPYPPWMLSVIGNARETIVTLGKAPQEE